MLVFHLQQLKLSDQLVSSGVTTVKGIGTFGFTAQELADADYVIMSCFTNNCNVLWDGTSPTTTFGHPLQAGISILAFDGNEKINKIKVVSQTGTSNITFTLEKYV